MGAESEYNPEDPEVVAAHEDANELYSMAEQVRDDDVEADKRAMIAEGQSKEDVEQFMANNPKPVNVSHLERAEDLQASRAEMARHASQHHEPDEVISNPGK